MKTKTLVILFVILGVLAGAGALIIHLRDTRSRSGEMGATLLKHLPANDIASIVIETPGAAVSLMKKSGAWIVEERFGYPADFSKITDLVKTLKQVKIGRKFEASEKVLRRLSLKAPGDADAPQEERGTRIRMTDSKGKTLLDMSLGKTRIRDKLKGPPDGQYVMLGNAREIYLIDKILSSFASGPAAWLEKSPVRVDAEEIRKITCQGPGAKGVRYTFERPGKGKDFELMDPPAHRNVKKSSLNRLSNALSSLEIEEVERPPAPPESIRKGVSPQLDYHLFDGRIYHVTTGKACSATLPCQIRFEVGYQRPGPAKKEADPASPTEKKAAAEAKGEEAVAAEAIKENERLKPWVFTIPEWQHKAFFTDLEQLLEKKAEKKGADRPPVK